MKSISNLKKLQSLNVGKVLTNAEQMRVIGGKQTCLGRPCSQGCCTGYCLNGVCTG